LTVLLNVIEVAVLNASNSGCHVIIFSVGCFISWMWWLV